MKFSVKELKDAPYRFCIPSLKLIEIDPKTNEVTGLMAEPFKVAFGMVKTVYKNITFIKPSESGSMLFDMKAKKLPGCWGVLQRGEADIYLYTHEMPIMGLENITQFNSSALQSGTYMLAPYSTNESFSMVAASPLGSFNSLSVDTWANAAIMTIMFGVIMLYIKTFVYKRPVDNDSSALERQDPREEDEALHGQSLVYQVITHVIQYETCDYTGGTVRYVSLLMSIFAFLFITLLSCMITCDKVSTRDIHVYDTYDKILANKSVQPVWVENLNDFAAYKRAAKGSKQAQLWQQSIAISKKDPERPTLIQTSLSEILKKVRVARKKDVVIFLSNMFTDIFVSVVCTVLATNYPAIQSMKDMRAKGRLDEHVITSIYVLPASIHSPVLKQIDFSFRRILETRVLHQPDMIHMVETHIAKEFLNEKINYNEDYYQCLEFKKLPSAETETAPLSLTNAFDLFRLWALGCSVSLVVLLLEHVHHKKKFSHSSSW